MSDEERKVLEYFRVLRGYAAPKDKHYYDTLEAMLARPVLPEEPTIDALIHMDNAIPGPTQYDNMRAAYRALYAHLTAPRTKEVEVWRVESVFHGHTRVWQANDGSKSEADRMAAYLATDGHVCIRVTGPHKQQVPA